jgi:Holliday junction resolvase RusA-like endonuclease
MALMQHGKLLLECPIHIEFEFNFKRGKTVKRKYHTVKPDLSNCIKSIEDAFNGVVYKDDCQIKKLTASKNYSNFEHVVVNVIPVLDGED